MLVFDGLTTRYCKRGQLGSSNWTAAISAWQGSLQLPACFVHCVLWFLGASDSMHMGLEILKDPKES